ncbi:hypothetical protein [Nonomuraea sp. SYSU D8015]|nr:hypothetical protein [Nonomuraea sp. SYSU D8015]
MRQNEAELTATKVDRQPWEATEDDEETVLKERFGPPDDDGIYRGEGA